MWIYYVGQPVVCLDGNWGQFARGSPGQMSACPNLPTEDCVYTIRDLIMGTEELFLRLVEVVNPENVSQGKLVEPIFQACRYRPLDEIRTTEARRVAEPA